MESHSAHGDDDQDEQYPDEHHRLSEDPDEIEGLYGGYEGSQYGDNETTDIDGYDLEYADEPTHIRADEGADPNAAPDMADLLDHPDAEVRVGAMQLRQYYSLRVEADDGPDPTHEYAPANVGIEDTLPQDARYALMDYDVVAVPNAGYPPWSAEADVAREDAGDPPVESYEHLLAGFDSRYGSGPRSAPATIELEAIEAVGSEEAARATWLSIINMQPAMLLSVTRDYLRSTAPNLDVLSEEYGHHVGNLRQLMLDLKQLLAGRHRVRSRINGLRDRPATIDVRICDVFEVAASFNGRLIEDIEMSLFLFDLRLGRAGSILRMVEEELTRRMLAREAFRRRVVTPVEEIMDEGSLAAPLPTLPLGDGRLLVPESEFEQLEPEDPAPSPPTSDPPSYPGSPHESDVYYPPEDLANSRRVPLVVDIESSPEGSPERPSAVLSLAAGRVEEAVESTLASDPIPANTPRGPEVILRSVVVNTSRDAERLTTYVLEDGTLEVVRSELPRLHPRHPAFRDAHRAAMHAAISQRAIENEVLVSEVEDWVYEGTRPTLDNHGNVIRDVDGFPDREPNLFPGLVYHEGLASSGPDGDDEDAWPGYRAQMLSQRVEHLSTIRRPRSLPPSKSPESVGLMDQPTRSSKTIACLTAMIKVGNSVAFALFDTGSNTDSITMEYAQVVNGVRITLDEQVTLQLGCVGSRSKISYGTRVPIDFGGMRGYVYFDQVNLDRYDVVIGTPFMNKHGAVLDFGKREIRFSNGHTIKALSSVEETALVDAKRAGAKGKGRVE
ncbi:hypothetical protein DFH06DRAFT_1351178 [Mycena polygramma]|nr:hypothetical protein DFH06DRAFT_1351178 [Mycena polygramma]